MFFDDFWPDCVAVTLKAPFISFLISLLTGKCATQILKPYTILVYGHIMDIAKKQK